MHFIVYDIIGAPQKDIVTIRTSDFGVVNINAALNSDAELRNPLIKLFWHRTSRKSALSI